MAIEQRILSTHASLRAESQGDELVLRGYAARFNVLSHPLPQGFREKIQPGAFKRSLAAGDDVVCTFNHSPDAVLGRKRSGTLKLAEDDKGLAFQCQLDKNQVAHRDLHASVKRGDISDCSFAFNVQDGGEDFSDGKDENGQRCMVRTLRNVKLHDVSVVTHPAYPQTSVDARKASAAVSAPASNIHTQIAAFNKRQSEKRRATIAQAQRAMAEMPELDLNTIIRCKRFSYSEDVILALRSTAIARTIRAGGGFSPLPMRADGGAVADPTQSLRDAVKYHRAEASKAHTMEECSRHHKAADDAEKKLAS